MTSAPKPVGYFRELGGRQDDAPSLREARDGLGDIDHLALAAYLRGGSVLAATSKLVPDALSEDPAPVARLETLTDGSWFWPGALAYYVERYRVALPPEFLSHARRQNWRPPQLTHEQLVDLADLLAPT